MLELQIITSSEEVPFPPSCVRSILSFPFLCLTKWRQTSKCPETILCLWRSLDFSESLPSLPPQPPPLVLSPTHTGKTHTEEHVCVCGAMTTSFLRRECPDGLSLVCVCVCVGWWGESNLNGVQSGRGGTQHNTTQHNTHTHTLVVNRIITHPGLSSCSKGDEKHQNWVEPLLGWRVRGGGSHPRFAIFSLFLSGVSNCASEIGETATSWNKVTQQLYFPLCLNRERADWERADWERASGPGGGFISLCVCTEQLCAHVCLCTCAFVCLCTCAGWQWFSGSNFPCHLHSC